MHPGAPDCSDHHGGEHEGCDQERYDNAAAGKPAVDQQSEGKAQRELAEGRKQSEPHRVGHGPPEEPVAQEVLIILDADESGAFEPVFGGEERERDAPLKGVERQARQQQQGGQNQEESGAARGFQR